MPGTTRILLRSAKEPWQFCSARQYVDHNIPGNNVGNLVFGQAVHRALSTRTAEVTSNRFMQSPARAAQINERYDVFVVPLANAFRPSFADSLQRLTQLIQSLRIPVVVVGVGAQAPIGRDASRLEPIADTVRQFLRAVLDRSASIGVRGEFTDDYVRSLGFDDVEVIGCPSMFMWGDDLSVKPKVDSLDRESAVTLGVSPYVDEIAHVVSHHVRRYPNLTYVPQDVSTLRRMVYGSMPEDRERHSDQPIYLDHPLFRQGKVRFPLDPRSWMEHLAGRDFYFGTRVHGTIVSLLSGTPAVLLAHDSRTLELARYHELPYRTVDSLPANVDAAPLYDEADFSRFHDGHASRFAAYCGFLERNGLRHVFQPGESPAAFDGRLAAASLPSMVSRATRSPRIRQLETAARTRYRAVRSSQSSG